MAKRGVSGSERLGKHIAGSWSELMAGLQALGQLRLRFKRRLDILLALLKLAAAIICARSLNRWCSPLLAG